jgi:hypothetical protein
VLGNEKEGMLQEDHMDEEIESEPSVEEKASKESP